MDRELPILNSLSRVEASRVFNQVARWPVDPEPIILVNESKLVNALIRISQQPLTPTERKRLGLELDKE